MKELNIIDENASKVLLATAANNGAQVFAVVGKIVNDIRPILEDIIKATDAVDEIADLPRLPEEIKKDIKHEKNPMRLKQLNKELNESYKAYKKVRNNK